MGRTLPLFPEAASTQAGNVDLLYFAVVAISAFFAVLIAALVITFAVKFRRRSPDEVGAPITGSLALELLWTIIPLMITLSLFVWGAWVFLDMARPPRGSMEIYVVGKQWMWKVQHPDGQREINELHVPVGRNVRLTIGSEDVIHSYYIPAFRQKIDAVPGRLTTMWFNATKPGEYHLFCAEYCGTKHSGMIGRIVVMEPDDFEQWLAGGAGASTSASGEKLFNDLACVTCHKSDSGGRGPVLNGVPGTMVQLTGGGSVLADDNYLRESIMNPGAKIVAGYQPLMPTFQGLVSEEGLLQLISYIKSLPPASNSAGDTAPAAAPAAAPAPGGAGQ
ncbi:MAG: cytochrome c oxidase subunit II [Acidobacteria bacterium]|nr:cytochrome c oxidase subunit II [Acidobacteriota bacterium]